MNRLLTDEQAAYLAQLYTGAEVPKLHHAPTAYVRELERTCAERGMTIHRLERRLHKVNRKHAALHRAMHEDTKKISGALCKSVDRFFASLARDSAPVEWPRFEDGEPVLIGNWIAAEMGPFKVGSILFCDGHVLIYDEQHFHYVKLRDGEFAEHDPYGRR